MKLTMANREAMPHLWQRVVTGAAFAVCSAAVVAVEEIVPSALDKTIVETVADGSAAEEGRSLSNAVFEFAGLLDDVGAGVGTTLAVAFSGLNVVDTSTAVLFAGLGVGRLLGNASALPPVQSASPPSFTTIPTPAIASPNPLSF